MSQHLHHNSVFVANVPVSCCEAERIGGEVEAAVVEAVVTPVVRSLLLSVLSHNAVTV